MLSLNALLPIAVFRPPVVLAFNAVVPKAVFEDCAPAPRPAVSPSIEGPADPALAKAAKLARLRGIAMIKLLG